jgi:hypothetical protein
MQSQSTKDIVHNPLDIPISFITTALLLVGKLEAHSIGCYGDVSITAKFLQHVTTQPTTKSPNLSMTPSTPVLDLVP